MAYTVKKLAKLSGVSVRTLHFYDEIGLLKPAYYGENNYRYYEDEQLLLLQQILFYRELGFPLNEIQRIISSDDFNKFEALESHKRILEQSLDRSQQLIKTIDKTMAHLRGKITMKNEEFFKGFYDAKKQAEYDQFLIERGVTQEQIDQSWENIKDWKKADWEKFKREKEALNKEFVLAIQNNLQPSSPEVQKLVKKHYQMVKLFWTPTKDSYVSLSQLYREHSDFQKFYQHYHPQLLEFLTQAMKIFAERELD